MRPLTAVMALALCTATPGAGAQSAHPATVSGFYAGAGIGDAEPSSWDNDYWYSDIESGDSDTSLSLFAGYRFNRHVAAELGWFDAGTMGWEQSLVYVPDLLDVYNTDVHLEVTAVNASAIGILPFARIWEGYIRGGLTFYDAEAGQRLTPSFGGATVDRSVDDSGADFLFGIGVGVTLFDRAHLRLEFQSFFIDEDLLAAEDDTASVDTLLLDVQYRFGDGWQAGGSP
ncbi:MAG: porin family protein [Gammaproteobacteria bacterium]|nr:porin family protein [Gammaproteobacteria bacterium]